MYVKTKFSIRKFISSNSCNSKQHITFSNIIQNKKKNHKKKNALTVLLIKFFDPPEIHCIFLILLQILQVFLNFIRVSLVHIQVYHHLPHKLLVYIYQSIAFVLIGLQRLHRLHFSNMRHKQNKNGLINCKLCTFIYLFCPGLRFL